MRLLDYEPEEDQAVCEGKALQKPWRLITGASSPFNWANNLLKRMRNLTGKDIIVQAEVNLQKGQCSSTVNAHGPQICGMIYGECFTLLTENITSSPKTVVGIRQKYSRKNQQSSQEGQSHGRSASTLTKPWIAFFRLLLLLSQQGFFCTKNISCTFLFCATNSKASKRLKPWDWTQFVQCIQARTDECRTLCHWPVLPRWRACVWYHAKGTRCLPTCYWDYPTLGFGKTNSWYSVSISGQDLEQQRPAVVHGMYIEDCLTFVTQLLDGCRNRRRNCMHMVFSREHVGLF